MATTQSNALKHWARIIKRWPVDKVRPESIAFQKVMQDRTQRSIQPVRVPADQSQKAPVTPAPAPTPRPWNEAREMKDVNALYNLLDDRFAKQYPMPESLRYPASSPSHYDDMVRELDEAPTRSWFGNLMNRVRGSMRLS